MCDRKKYFFQLMFTVVQTMIHNVSDPMFLYLFSFLLMHFQHRPGFVIAACPLPQFEHSFMILLCRICIKSLESNPTQKYPDLFPLYPHQRQVPCCKQSQRLPHPCFLQPVPTQYFFHCHPFPPL